jgi:hypothetical protein
MTLDDVDEWDQSPHASAKASTLPQLRWVRRVDTVQVRLVARQAAVQEDRSRCRSNQEHGEILETVKRRER